MKQEIKLHPLTRVITIMKKNVILFFIAAVGLSQLQSVELSAKTSSLACEDSCERSCQYGNNVYLGFESGFNFMANKVVDCASDVHTKVGYCVGGLLGYQIKHGLAFEVEAAYRNDAVKNINFLGACINTPCHIHSIAVFGNVIYEIPYWCWKPNFGFGLGYAQENARVTQFCLPSDRKFKDFAYQLMTGLGYNFWSCMDIGLEYKYMHVKHSYIHNHALLLNVRYHF